MKHLYSFLFLCILSGSSWTIGAYDKDELEKLWNECQECSTVLTLFRGGCLGSCPVFSLYIVSDGSSLNFGKYESSFGELFLVLTNKEIEAIHREFELIDFFSIPKKCCDCSGHTDNSSTTITYSADYKTHRIHNYWGCLSSDDWGRKLRELEERILGIVGIPQYSY